MGTLDVRSATVQLCMGPLRLSKIRKRRYTQAAPWNFENESCSERRVLLMLDGGR